MPKSKLIAFWSILIFVVVAGTALGAELILRIVNYRQAFAGASYKTDGIIGPHHLTFDSVTGYALIPNMRDQDRGISTDQFGDRITSRPFDKAKRSIVLVGDSTVFGWGVRDEDTFAYKLSLDSRFKDFNIVNLGVPSYSLGHIVAVLQNKIAQYNPAVVVVSVLWPWKAFEAAEYGSSDGWKNIDLNFYRKLYPVRSRFEQPDGLSLRNSKLLSFIRDGYFRMRYSKEIQENMTRPGVRDFDIPRDQEIAYARQHVASLTGVTLPKKTKIIYYVHPYQYTIFHDQYLRLGEAGYSELIQGLHSTDLKPLIRQAYKGDPLYIDGSHLTPAGHDVFERILGDMIAAAID